MKLNKKMQAIIFITLILDQISKIVINTSLKENASIKVLGKFFKLTNVYNEGAAFSLFDGSKVFLIIISVISILLLLYMMKDFKNSKLNYIAFGLIYGGILGNLIDRLFLGYVRDFLDFNIFGFHYPVFNLADSFIVIGVIILIIDLIKGEKNGVSSKRK